MKMFRKLLVAASILMFASVGAFALDADDIEIFQMGTMSDSDFTNYFGNTYASQIAEDVFDGELELEEIQDDELPDYVYDMLDTMAESVGRVSSDTVIGVCDDEILVIVHMGSNNFFAYYYE